MRRLPTISIFRFRPITTIILQALITALMLATIIGSVQVSVRFSIPSGELKPLPGATVTLHPPAGGPPVAGVTDDDGNTRFESLQPGDYVIAAEMEGFRTIRKRVTVTGGSTVAVAIELPLAQLSTTVEVRVDSTREAARQSELPMELKQELIRIAPLVNEKFQDALPLVPGVLRGPDGLLNLKGARASQSGLLVNSVNVTDPVTGQYAMELPIEAIEDVKVHANPYSSEFGKFTGAVTTIETRQGTNSFKFLFTNFFPRFRWEDGTVKGLESFTPRLAVSGPIVKNKLWYIQNFDYRYILTPVPSLPERYNDTKTETFDSFTRLDWAINESHNATAVLSLYPQNLSYVNLDTFHPQGVTPNYRQRGFFAAFNEKAVLNLNSLLDTTFSVKDLEARIWGQSLDPMTITPGVWEGAYYNTQDRRSRRYEWAQTVTVSQRRWLGQHNPRLGYLISRASFTGTDLSREVRIRREDGTLFERFEFVGPGALDQGVTEATAFFQDAWQISAPLTLDLGVRFDWDSLSRQAHLAPRTGFAWLPFPRDPRTVVRGGFGVFYDKIPLNAGAFTQYQQFRVTDYAGDGMTAVRGPLTFANVVDGGRLENPYSLTWNLELDREVFPGLLIRLGFQNREQRHDLLLKARDGATPQLALSNLGSSSYREWLASLRFRFRKEDELTFSYVRSSAVGNLNAFETYFGNYHYPVIRPDEIGPQPFDVPNRFLLTGITRLPWGFRLAPVVDIRDGFPYSRTDQEQRFVSARNRGGRFPLFFSLDFSVVKQVDIKFLKKVYRTHIGIKVYNLTNHWNPRDVQGNVDSPDSGTFYNSVGRLFRGKFEIDF